MKLPRLVRDFYSWLGLYPDVFFEEVTIFLNSTRLHRQLCSVVQALLSTNGVRVDVRATTASYYPLPFPYVRIESASYCHSLQMWEQTRLEATAAFTCLGQQGYYCNPSLPELGVNEAR